MKIIITGGAGFIGTNTVQYYLDKGWEVLNLSHSKPRNAVHSSCWRKVSVDNYEELKNTIDIFNPDYIIHLAGRTDMNGENLEDYAINIDGTRNIIKAARECHSIRKILFTSSSHVCMPNSIQINEREYSPRNYYGKSKAVAEELIWNNPPKCDWSIIRPTSIWGPWQTTSYISFFKAILNDHYFHISNCNSKKTFGYVGNMVFQMDALLHTDTNGDKKKVFYIGDYDPYDITDWADEIAAIIGKRIQRIPYWIAKSVAIIGDVLNASRINFPLTSHRLINMRTDNVVDLREIKKIANPLPYTRESGVIETIKWIKNN